MAHNYGKDLLRGCESGEETRQMGGWIFKEDFNSLLQYDVSCTPS